MSALASFETQTNLLENFTSKDETMNEKTMNEKQEEQKRDLEIWSFSKIRATKGCKLAFEYEYILQLPPDTIVPEFEIAKELHKNLQTKFKEKTIENEDIKKLLDHYEIIEIERPYEYEFPEINAKFVGFADIVLENEEERLIIDLKTRYSPEITEDDHLQLEIYSALSNIENPKKTKIGIYAIHNKYCPLNVKESKIYLQSSLEKFIISEILWARERIKKMKVEVSNCNFCKYRRRCNYGNLETDENDIYEIAKKYLHLKAQLKRYENILKNYVETTGFPIQIKDKMLGFFETIQTKVDPIVFISLCKELGINFIDALRIDTRKAKELAKKYEALLQAFDFEVKYEFKLKNGK
jgi:hypothetical protein